MGSQFKWNNQLHVLSGTTLYVGGSFTIIGGNTINRLAEIDATTGNVNAAWTPDPDAQVNALDVSGSTLYIGGNFLNIAGQARSYLAAINTGTGNITTWNH